MSFFADPSAMTWTSVPTRVATPVTAPLLTARTQLGDINATAKRDSKMTTKLNSGTKKNTSEPLQILIIEYFRTFKVHRYDSLALWV